MIDKYFDQIRLTETIDPYGRKVYTFSLELKQRMEIAADVISQSPYVAKDLHSEVIFRLFNKVIDDLYGDELAPIQSDLIYLLAELRKTQNHGYACEKIHNVVSRISDMLFVDDRFKQYLECKK
jgi:hypothetical protein